MVLHDFSFSFNIYSDSSSVVGIMQAYFGETMDQKL